MPGPIFLSLQGAKSVLPSGVLAFPSIRIGNVQSGLFSPADNEIQFTHGAVGGVRFNRFGLGFSTGTGGAPTASYPLVIKGNTTGNLEFILDNSGTGVTAAEGILFLENGAGRGYIYTTNTGSGIAVGTMVLGGSGTAGALNLQTANTNRVQITNNGRIIIGTYDGNVLFNVGVGRSYFSANSEPYSLHVKYNTTMGGMFIGQNGVGNLQFSDPNGVQMLRMYRDGTGVISMYTDVAADSCITIPNIANGYGWVRANAFQTWSSLENKSDIRPLVDGETTPKLVRRRKAPKRRDVPNFRNMRKSGGGTRTSILGEVKKLHPVLYRGKFEDDTIADVDDLGLIAEEVANIFPEITALDPYTGEPNGIMYDRLSVILLQAVKELEGRLTTLEDERKN